MRRHLIENGKCQTILVIVVHPLPERASSILLEAFPPCRGEVKSVQLTANDYGVESGATVSSDGLQVVNSGASARGMTITGGEEYVASRRHREQHQARLIKSGPRCGAVRLGDAAFAFLRHSPKLGGDIHGFDCARLLNTNASQFN
jgi:autotransporter passenger strand-loop-strand repeat protein